MQKHTESVLEDFFLSQRHLKIYGLYIATLLKALLDFNFFFRFFQSKKDLHSLKLPVNPKENKNLSLVFCQSG